jgi:DNA repair protein RecO
MAYQTYTTEAFVCGVFNRNTADRSCLLLTREAGMLFADVKSAREERSRQRYGLQEFSLVRLSLVRGKAGWRVGSTEALGNYYHQAVDQAARGSVVRLFRLVRRFYQGEEPHPELFDFLRQSLARLSGVVSARSHDELVAEVMLLVELGYVDRKRLPRGWGVVTGDALAPQLAEADMGMLRQLREHAIQVSQL